MEVGEVTTNITSVKDDNMISSKASFINDPARMVKDLDRMAEALDELADSVNPYTVFRDETLSPYNRVSFIRSLAMVDSALRSVRSAACHMGVTADGVVEDNDPNEDSEE